MTTQPSRASSRRLALPSPGCRSPDPRWPSGPTYDPGTWIGSIGKLLHGLPELRTLTVHRYPLRNCFVPPSSKQYPTVAHLLSGYATAALAASLRPWVQIAHSAHRLLRVDELNSVACRGKAGVSDTFASSLWATDALFALARAGVDGVNLHTLPKAAYELFHFTDTRARVVGLRPAGLLRPSALRAGRTARRPPARREWAHRGHRTERLGHPDGRGRPARGADQRESDPRHGRSACAWRPGREAPPGSSGFRRPASHARTGVTWGGRSYGSATTSGRLAAPQTQTLTRRAGRYTLSVRHGSAALVTFPAR